MPAPRAALAWMAFVSLTGAGAPCLAQTSGSVAPLAISDAGPWEAVVWGKGRVVDHCTLSRARAAPPGLSFGFMIDHEVIILGMESAAWRFARNARPGVTLTLAGGAQIKATPQAVSPTRVNLFIDKPALALLQRAAHLDVDIDGKRSRLPFDDFNAARVVLEICVQQLGKEYRP